MDSNPILNNPYQEPQLHYATDSEGNLDYGEIRQGRRVFKPSLSVVPQRQAAQKQVFEWNDDTTSFQDHIINRCRKEVAAWRLQEYPDTTRITKELLSFWFLNSERLVTKKLFFAQQEAIETAIWLNEVAKKSTAGRYILDTLQKEQTSVSASTHDQLPRIAFKMATGSGKTVVMACLICYHYFNRQEYRNDERFADYFLLVAPGVTIKDRLGVLKVDTTNDASRKEDYYHIRALVPPAMEQRLQGLNARLVITNYHAFEPKILQGNKRSPFDGKVNLKGEKADTGNKENTTQVMKRVLAKFNQGSRLLVLNDEAHHCYLPKSSTATTDNEESDENKKAAVWFSGLRDIAQKFKVQTVYDLSATPYYLQGSGYEAYSLFPWVVSDFGLIEAIESGLVKIPFLPERDNTQVLEKDGNQVIPAPVLRDLYRNVIEQDPNALPRKGQRTIKSEQKKSAKALSTEAPPKLPALVQGALDQFYEHYEEYDKGTRKKQEARADIFTAPPVFIVVCNNTSVSKELYKHIAGYEFLDATGKNVVVTGRCDTFSNYDKATNALLKRPPTLLIDSEALEDGNQINNDFKTIFAAEIAEFKRDYVRLKGQGSAENITDAEILREVVNTVGQRGKLGAHIRCVVSVSMLTEGWDANTVTHIMGLRAFGSQLLCEQVAGRALRRMSYVLKAYRKDTGEEVAEKDKHKFKTENLIEKFPPEYAHIIGIPFKLFKSGTTEPPPPPQEQTHIAAIPERQEALEITFPNVVGYRIENPDGVIRHDFSTIEQYEIDGSVFPTETILASPISPNEEKLQVTSVLERRDQELIFLLTKELIKYHFSDDDGNPQIQHFATLKRIVEEWYHTKVALLNIPDKRYKRLLFFHQPKTITDHIARGINRHLNTAEYIRPVLSHYNPFGSTKHVRGTTVKETYPTLRSHVNAVVMDSDWEAIAAKTLEEIPDVLSYVKNQFLGFAIPYTGAGKDKLYFPDFIARVQTRDGTVKNLIIEITGMSRDKAEKLWFVEQRWLPAVNAIQSQYALGEWHCIEVANDIRNIKNQLINKISSL